nr:hypothetical protein [Tanacetum cinerariifolium]
MVVSDSDEEEGTTPNVNLEALCALANATVANDLDAATDVPAATSPTPPGTSRVDTGTTEVATGTIEADTGTSGVATVARQLHEEELAAMEREQEEAHRKRQHEVLESAKFYTVDDWLNIQAQLEANASLSKSLVIDDVGDVWKAVPIWEFFVEGLEPAAVSGWAELWSCSRTGATGSGDGGLEGVVN